MIVQAKNRSVWSARTISWLVASRVSAVNATNTARVGAKTSPNPVTLGVPGRAGGATSVARLVLRNILLTVRTRGPIGIGKIPYLAGRPMFRRWAIAAA